MTSLSAIISTLYVISNIKNILKLTKQTFWTLLVYVFTWKIEEYELANAWVVANCSFCSSFLTSKQSPETEKRFSFMKKGRFTPKQVVR